MGYFKNKLIKEDHFYMSIAEIISQRSYDDVFKVGAIITRDNNILSYGWNGTPYGMDNDTRNNDGTTKWEVIHAEANAICKLALSAVSSKDATLYVTLSPCLECTKLLLQSKIKRIVYKDLYYNQGHKALEFLSENGVKIEKY